MVKEMERRAKIDLSRAEKKLEDFQMQMEEARSVIFAKEHNLGKQESENERLRAKCKLREREI